MKIVLEIQPRGGYSAYIPALPGCISEGDTAEAARRNLRDALRGYLKTARKRLPK